MFLDQFLHTNALVWLIFNSRTVIYIHGNIVVIKNCYVEREQLEARINQLAMDKEQLLNQLQCYEVDLRTKDECEHYVI